MFKDVPMTSAQQQRFKGMRFCDECDNMLEPREFVHDERHYLQFECKLCQRSQKALENSEAENCVYHTDYTTRAESLQVDGEWAKDPTLMRRRDTQCKHCNQRGDAVSFTRVTKERLSLVFLCARCHKWWEKAEDENEFSEDSA